MRADRALDAGGRYVGLCRQVCEDVNVATSVGRVLSGRFQVDELLGSGGMASVWRGRDLRLDRAVAIKELAGPWLADRSALRQFFREARMAARLAHPNIVAVYDVDIHDRTPFIVMELIEGETVAQLLTDDPLPIEAVVAIAAQASDGLTAAHAGGVIHRDIKPANLMLTHAGVVKICDFGIAKAIFGAADTTATGPLVAIGTSKYMARSRRPPGRSTPEPTSTRWAARSTRCSSGRRRSKAPWRKCFSSTSSSRPHRFAHIALTFRCHWMRW
jgi:serine/threonine protein kinase